MSTRTRTSSYTTNNTEFDNAGSLKPRTGHTTPNPQYD